MKDLRFDVMLGIVLINYRCEDELIHYISNELSKIECQNKIVVVNNSYSQESHEKLISGVSAINGISIDKDIYIITKKENLGYGKANNFGAQFLKDTFDVEYILFSNSDIEFKDDGVVDVLVKKIKETDDVGAIGPRVVDPNGNDQSPHDHPISFARYITKKLFPFLKGKVTILKKPVNTEVNLSGGITYWVSGCFFIVKSAAFFKSGMFDDNIFMYGEEQILSERMKMIGSKMYFEPAVTIIHKEDYREQNEIIDRKYNEAHISNIYYYINYTETNSAIIYTLNFIFRIKMKLIK